MVNKIHPRVNRITAVARLPGAPRTAGRDIGHLRLGRGFVEGRRRQRLRAPCWWFASTNYYVAVLA